MLSVYRIALAVVLIGVAGCATTQQANTVMKTGFLDDYSILQKGEKGEALLRYRNPTAEWKKYNKVMIDPVQVWMGKSSRFHNLPREEIFRLSELLFGKLRDGLLADYQIVLEPGPDVMRISVALTEAEASDVTLDTISSILPTGYVVSGTKSLTTGTATFIGTASAEVKITDAQHGTLLAAAVDRRGGAKSLSGVTSEWNDVEESFEYWASMLRYRLCLWRGQRSCAEPSA